MPTATDRFRWPALVDRVAADIHAGRLAPGSWLKQIELERRYGFSRGDVRKALDDLVARRLVRHLPNRGYHVTPLDPRRIVHLAELRAVLEAAIAEQIHDQASPAQLDELDRLARHFAETVRHGTLLQQHTANQAFHLALIALCPNPELAQAARDARDRSPSGLLYQWRTDGWISQSLQDHAAVVAALRARDGGALKRAMVGHLRVAERGAAVVAVIGRSGE